MRKLLHDDPGGFALASALILVASTFPLLIVAFIVDAIVGN